MTTLAIHWKNKESKNYVDLIPTSLFDAEVGDKEIEHDTRKPNGSTFAVRTIIRIKGNTATLTYRLSNNDPKSIWPGVTRILFETAERKVVRRIEWQDEGDATFVVPDPPPVWLEEDYEESEDQRGFVIKTDSIEQSGKLLSLQARPIAKMQGGDISVGDRVFVWLLEEDGGQGITWYGSVRNLDKQRTNDYHIQLADLRKTSSLFGTRELDEFRHSTDVYEASLYEKLKGYSHRGIRRIERDEVGRLMPLFDAHDFEADGHNEVARLKRLGNVALRPDQAKFSVRIRRAYQGKCAFTGCTTAEALEAAHIKVEKGQDDNNLRNGLLLRADVHALFDEGLIALTLDGSRVEISSRLSDTTYDFLRTREVSQPQSERPSEENIRHHRLRFGFHCP
ncbi:HNH endonuclease [Bradyrhizobium manausense]|uniref:HNH endonuclease n=1 Tax=Bradyrhizobium TaxID=374 RepID=UPI001BAA2215|nr:MULTISPECIES: HNH endonuclease signature motif containing protein [Bradyrhizobium]MBR0825970.1 HNH endonuclease [Bradyrhizobium manausense]UVO31102.1 HNH endonuclease [Bradyrhizobium arachidis]